MTLEYEVVLPPSKVRTYYIKGQVLLLGNNFSEQPSSSIRSSTLGVRKLPNTLRPRPMTPMAMTLSPSRTFHELCTPEESLENNYSGSDKTAARQSW